MLRFLLIVSIFSFIALFPYKYSEASFVDREKIIHLDHSENDDIITLNNFLSKGNILDYFKVRQKLLSLTYTDLNRLLERTKAIDSTGELKNLLKIVISKKEQDNIYNLKEDIFINNMPVQIDSPFYGNLEQGLKIIDLKPHAERMYFNNLKLKYRKNRLLKETDKLWINYESVKKDTPKIKRHNRIPEKENGWSSDRLGNEATEVWSYRLKDDNLHDFFFDLRQWIKRYEENLMTPIIYKDTVIIRNEYRLYCLGLVSGKEIWSFGNLDKTGHEYYQTFRHPHHNSYGYEALLVNDTIFTELAEKLVAVSLEDIINPRLLWSRDLGEYTLYTKPVQIKGVLVVGLINSREELWICGFNCQRGTLEWNTYIGSSSFLSPTCVISAVDNDRIFIGTNHGVLVCLSSENGEIIWLRKYTPKNYSLFDYWMRGYYKDKILNKGSIEYDNQFIEVGSDKLLYYKPRESDYLYVLDAATGHIKEDLLIDSDRFYVLRAYNGKAVFLEKKVDTKEDLELKVIELESGKEIYNIVTKGGALKGINLINRDEILFKLDDITHFLRIDGDNVNHTKVNTSAAGWLLDFKDRFLFIADENSLLCMDIFDRKYSYNTNDDSLTEYLKQKEIVKNKLDSLFEIDEENPLALKDRKRLLSDIKMSRIPLDEIISYKDIEIRFSNFLYETGLINYRYTEDNEYPAKSKSNINDFKNFQVKGENIFLVPIDVIKGPRLLDFFLLLNKDQLICVGEGGDIRWSRKILCGYPRGEHQFTFFPDLIEVYLYNNSLIINDFTNVIGVDVNDGSYIWSMINLKRKMLYTNFLDDSLIIINTNKVYSINPATGYCKKYRELDIDGARTVDVAGEYLYLLPDSLDSIKVLDKELETVGNLLLDLISPGKKIQPEFFFINSYIVLHIKPYLYIIDKEGTELKSKFNISDLDWYYLEAYEDNLLVVVPFQKLTAYHLEGGSLILKWEFNLGSEGQQTAGMHTKKDAKYYFIGDGYICLPFRKRDNYFLASLDLRTGQKLWERSIDGVKGLIYNLSEVKSFDGIINFIISTIYIRDYLDEIDIYSKALNISIDSKLFSLNIENGNVLKTEALPSVGGWRFTNVDIIETRNHMIYSIYGNFLKAAGKNVK